MASSTLGHGIDELMQPDGWRTIYDFWFPAGLIDADLEASLQDAAARMRSVLCDDLREHVSIALTNVA